MAAWLRPSRSRWTTTTSNCDGGRLGRDVGRDHEHRLLTNGHVGRYRLRLRPKNWSRSTSFIGARGRPALRQRHPASRLTACSLRLLGAFGATYLLSQTIETRLFHVRDQLDLGYPDRRSRQVYGGFKFGGFEIWVGGQQAARPRSPGRLQRHRSVPHDAPAEAVSFNYGADFGDSRQKIGNNNIDDPFIRIVLTNNQWINGGVSSILDSKAAG
jgi:hypothetical protein